MSETPEIACTECGSRETQKQLGSGAGIVFKGSGFYVTDYKNQGKSPPEPAAKPKADKKNTSTGAK